MLKLETPASGKFKFKNLSDGKYIINFYSKDGYGLTQNVLVEGADKKDVNPKLNPNPDQVQLKIKPTVEGASLKWRAVSGAAKLHYLQRQQRNYNDQSNIIR